MKKNASLSRMGEKEKYRNPKSSEGILQIFREFLSNLKNDLKLPEICFMMIGLIWLQCSHWMFEDSQDDEFPPSFAVGIPDMVAR